MLVTLLVVVVLVVHRVVETEAVDIARCAGRDDMSVIEGDDELLDEVGERKQVKGFVINGVVDEDVFLLVDCQEVAPVTVPNQLAVRDLDILQDLDLVVDDREDLEPGGEADSDEESTWVHGNREGFFSEEV